MKTAKAHISVIEFTCPECGEFIASENGSFLFPLDEIPNELSCDCCGNKSKVPKKWRKK